MSKQQKDKNKDSIEKKEFLAAKAKRPRIKVDYYLQYFWNDEWNTKN